MPVTKQAHATSEVRFESEILGGETVFSLLLPPSYSEKSEPYPILFALHGGGANHLQPFVDRSRIVEFLDARDLVVVAPDSCPLCCYLDGVPIDERPPPGPMPVETDNPALIEAFRNRPRTFWEQFFVRELLAYVESNYNVRRDRSGRGLLGYSMGGFGTAFWTTKRPDLFSFGGSMSGPLHLFCDEPTIALGERGLSAIIGSSQTHGWRWRDVNPWDLAPNLVGTQTRIVITSGDAVTSDDIDPELSSKIGNTAAEMMAVSNARAYAARLEELGISHRLLIYQGLHNDWGRELDGEPTGADLGLKMILDEAWEHFTSEPSVPATFSYRTMSAEFEIWGYRVQVMRRNHEFLFLERVSREGLRVRGSGVVSISTPPVYEAGSAYEIVTNGDVRRCTADAEGRLAFDVELGAEGHEDVVDPADEQRLRSTENVVEIREEAPA